ncbi:metallothionein 3 [Striga hermonthica]|uniref:Metallothionein 3 n=1 Tax=Striga hermonthica TaxID=68872 RepID=A0A9N7MM25_STRHE|nr:metallothionein 3 [Striga hermonthica]
MADKCTGCDCSDKSQCVKKGYAADLIETEPSLFFSENVDMGVLAAGENDGKCKCGSSCTCTNCTCGGH